MATTTMIENADSPTLKRAFTPELVPNRTVRTKNIERNLSEPSALLYPTYRPSCGEDSSGQRPRRRGFGPPSPPVKQRNSSMPVQTSSRPIVPMPTFMSVFGEESNTGSRETGSHGGALGRPSSSGNTLYGSHSSNSHFPYHQHRDSTSTSASESSESSPTTTISTMDSSSMTDPSPGPSPESPHAKMLPSSFVADFRSRRTPTDQTDAPQNAFFELARPTTPAKKARNLKNLGINTTTVLNNRAAHPSGTAPLPALAKKENVSAPSSPSFIKPPTPKRRPSALGLSIQTPGSNENKPPMRLVIPPTPAFNRPALRHFQSSPSLPLMSPSVAPSGGMKFPPLRPVKPNPRGFAEVPIEQEEEEDQEPNFDIPQSREEKPAAYPHGPICIYESGVFLYFEPTAEQASNYDVIFNVASEVKNPFTNPGNQDSLQELERRRRDGEPITKPGADTVDFAAVPLVPREGSVDTQGSSPTTPKANALVGSVAPPQPVENVPALKAPEYIHIPWEHNTDIVPDLHRLVQIIDDRVQQGKRVLVHCQCGVSRSASLIVAYGLYKNPGISVQDAYDAVKKRSKWIGPNMNLIMQLQEFRNGLLKSNGDRSFHNQVYGLSLPRRSGGLPTTASSGANARRSPFDGDSSSGPRTPRTAPLPPDNDSGLQRASTGNMMAISPGPLSAPSGALFSPGFRASWTPSRTDYDLSSPTVTTPYVDPKGHVVPMVAVTKNNQTTLEQPKQQNERRDTEPDLKPLPVPNFSRPVSLKKPTDEPIAQDPDFAPSIASPRSEEFHMAPVKEDAFDESFGLLSPRGTGFNISPPPGTRHQEATPFGISQTPKLQGPPKRNNLAKHSPLPSIAALQLNSSASPERTVEAPPLMSPRAAEFHMAPFKQDDFDGSFGLLSPKATSFNLDHSPGLGDSHEPSHQSQSSLEIVSPTNTEFPKDIWDRKPSPALPEVVSPRSEEFHMTPLKPKEVAEEDPYGLTSPRKFEFSHDPFTSDTFPDLTKDSQAPPALPRSIQAIHPTTEPDRSSGFAGFGSLNGSAHVQPAVSSLAPLPGFQLSSPPSRFDSVSSSPEAPHTPKIEQTGQTSISPPASEPTRHTLLITPPRQPALKTRFSSPNMRDQKRLHKLQTEMEALLPQRSPKFPVDDLDALMSPRAEEFTKNPFHIDLASPQEDPSPASSVETIKESKEWKDTSDKWQSSRPVDEDPRSPVQKGGSPIVRNIWDVL